MVKSEPSFADIAVALKLHANDLAERANNVEVTAGRIGLSPAIAQHLLDERRRQAELVGKAHELVKALISIEAPVRCLLNDLRDAGGGKAFVSMSAWRQLYRGSQNRFAADE
jgi:hypothetical protein